MMDFVAMFSGPQDLVVDLCALTMTVAKVCLLLSDHRRVVVCKKDEVVVIEA